MPKADAFSSLVPEKQWSEPEKWVWQEILAGRIADFNAREGRQDTPLKPTTSQGWSDERKLRSDFLKQILLRQPYSAEIPAEGVRIVGAWFAEAVELSHGRLARQLWLKNCRFEGPAKLEGLQIDGWFSLEGSTFAAQGTGATVDLVGVKVGGELNLNGTTLDGKLVMNRLDVAHDLFMGEDAKFKDVDFIGAKVGGFLSLAGATFNGKLDMSGLEVAQGMGMSEGAKFKDVDLVGAKVGGQLNLAGATLDGKLDMNGVDVAQHLGMGAGAKFKDVVLTGAKVGGWLSLDGATFDGKLDMESLVVDGEVSMRGSKFNERVSLLFARFGGNLDLSNSELTQLDLSGARIEGELCLGSNQHSRTRWPTGAAVRLNLRNVHIGTLQDVAEQREKRPWWRWRSGDGERWEGAWPAGIQLDGFTYDRLGGFGGRQERVEELQGSSVVDMRARDVGWYIYWLTLDHFYSPQPYEQLAGAFRAAGDSTKANRILYESRRQARREAWRRGWRQRFRWFGSYLLALTIGYGLGYRYFRALVWVILFMSLGAVILSFSGQPREGLTPGLHERFVYSLDQILLFLEFEKYDKVALTGWVKYYFYFQKLVGWALGSFLIAGLAGLTQKQ